jgi:4-hydroxybenzoate polyprenyltransferase
MVLATMCVGASGYVINDYFDTRTDQINRPQRVVVGKFVSRRETMALHVVFSLMSIILGTLVSARVGLPSLGIIYAMITGLLWFYSTTYKRQIFLGNFVVALLTAIVPYMVLLYEIPMIRKAYMPDMNYFHVSLAYIWYWVSAFAVFAFMMSVIREIIKDIEDIEGDTLHGRNTLPIKWGVKAVKIIVLSLTIISLALLGWLMYNFVFDKLSVSYLIVTVCLPWIYTIFYTLKGKTPSDFHKASIGCKITMLTGLGYALIARYIILSQFT